MWIKWFYNDHGHGGYKELEVPKGYTPVEYLCETQQVPTWSERFSEGRIKWEEISGPSPATLQAEIRKLTKEIEWRVEKKAELEQMAVEQALTK
jgi:transposase-like protein